jgi:hypothetical protein
MKRSCHFLKPDLLAHGLRCTAGVNFASVGPDREVCRVCPLADLGDLPLCPNVDVYTHLAWCASATARVEVEFSCLVDSAAPTEGHCARCPDGVRDGHLASGMQMVHSIQDACSLTK